MSNNPIFAAKDSAMPYLKRIDRRLWPLIIVAITLVIVIVLNLSKPSAGRSATQTAPQMVVEVFDVTPVDHQLMIESYGTVQPRTQSFLVSQVSGMVTWVADKFRDGAFISEGDLLLTIDDRDYLADVNIAEASLADAQQAYAEELARSEQARVDWERLGQDGEPSDLVLRKPQLQAAEARMRSAESALSKAQLSLERTKIVAPFDGRIINSFVDVGQVVGNNTQLTEIYATDYVEIRLPLKDSDLPFVDLPEERRGDSSEAEVQPDVTLISGFGNGDQWQGKIVRVESTIDVSARQLHVVAQIDDPFATKQTNVIKIGQYVTAEIQGRTISDAVIIPNTAIYQNSFVYVAENGALQRREIDIVWQSGTESILGSGLSFGDRLVTTPLGQVTSGTRIAISGEESEEAAPMRRASGSEQNDQVSESGSDSSSEKGSAEKTSVLEASDTKQQVSVPVSNP